MGDTKENMRVNRLLTRKGLKICRILHGKCVRTVFTHELVKYRKSNE